MIYLNSNIIKPKTLELLRTFQKDSELDNFFLVGGTALALHLGHRLSIDLDMFTKESFDVGTLENHLLEKHGFHTDYMATNTLKGFIDDIKVDFITHQNQLIEPLKLDDELRLASIADIAAMKLNAIARNGQRQKDFYDVYFILEQFPMRQLLEFYEQKYPNSNALIPLKGLTYFDDIDFMIEKPVLVKKASWAQIVSRLTEAVENFDRIF